MTVASGFLDVGAFSAWGEVVQVSIGRRAFTVAELVVAIGFLAIIAVVVIGLFVRLTASSSKSADQTVALEVANRLLEEHASSSPAVWKDLSSQQDLQTRVPGVATTFFYRFKFQQIDPDRSLMGALYRLDVDVFWWSGEGQPAHRSLSRRDYGMLQVHLARVVFLENFR